MRRRLALALLLLPLGACPPSQPGDTTDTASTGASAGATTGAVTTGPATATTGDMSSGTSTTGDATTAPATTTTTGDASTTGTATGEASTTGGTTGDASTTGGTTGGAVTFLCDGCLCDAGTTYCRKVLAGLIEPQGDPPLCPVVPEDPLISGCVAYPDACGDTPTCDCIPNLNNNCFCQEQMGTFILTCPLP